MRRANLIDLTKKYLDKRLRNSMTIGFKCTCGSTVFRLYYSWNKAQCHQCLKEYYLSEVLGGGMDIKHQRG